MRCRQDIISYYRNTLVVHEHLVEVIRRLWHSHDFASEHLVLTNAHDIDAAFLQDAARYFGASLMQFLAHSYLDSGGYITWAEVTRYYSRFFAVVAFTRLVGCATLWLSEVKALRRQDGRQFWILRNDEQQHGYLVGLRSDILRISRQESNQLPFEVPSGSGSHRTTWLLLAAICRAWDEDELARDAALPTPQQSSLFLDSWDSYEQRMMVELDERSQFNYLNEEVGFFFGELNGISRWGNDVAGWWHYYPNPLSESVPMEDTYEHKMTWSTIRYIASILAETPGRWSIERYLRLLENAPANHEMRAQIISELQSLLK